MPERPLPTRRRVLLALAASAGLAGCDSLPLGSASALVHVAPGVYLLPGSEGELAPDNRGRTGNLGVIVGERGVLVIDSGVSRRQGQVLMAEVSRISTQPLRALLLTHVRQEFVFGAAAFHDAGIPVRMHPAAARLMAGRCEGCLKTLQRVLGPDEMEGTRVGQPDRLPEAPQPEVALGQALSTAIGRPLTLLAFGPGGHSSGPGDLAVLDEPTGTLFAGGLLDAHSIPDVQDADFTGWRSGLDELERLPLQRIVPGHGPVSPPALIGSNRRYLAQLEARTAALLQAGTALSDVADATQLPEFAGWSQYDSIHRRNASVVFLRQERALMLRQP
jgi:glyoxylase-like metal-dependent hydrolase (beta-lactamase superfamily II)